MIGIILRWELFSIGQNISWRNTFLPCGCFLHESFPYPEPRSDIYSLGATMHCLLSGKTPMAPFDFKPIRNVNPKVSESIEKVVMKALSMDILGRYNSAGEMKETLMDLSASPQSQYGTFASKTVNIVSSSRIKSYVEPATGTKMIYIEGGNFLMGSNNEYESPIHSVTVDSFYIGKYAVTNREYKKYDFEHKGTWSDGNYPVESVSWNDAMAYCQWLSEKSGKNYRLPTEAEWEYACRAGTTTDYYWGDEINGNYCWYEDNSGGTIHPVGKKRPNAWGLYDMSGNVWEWCSDWYEENYYSSSLLNNPTGPASGLNRVIRGGSWGLDEDAIGFRSAERNYHSPDDCNYTVGFRIVSIPL